MKCRFQLMIFYQSKLREPFIDGNLEMECWSLGNIAMYFWSPVLTMKTNDEEDGAHHLEKRISIFCSIMTWILSSLDRPLFPIHFPESSESKGNVWVYYTHEYWTTLFTHLSLNSPSDLRIIDYISYSKQFYKVFKTDWKKNI